MADHGVISGIYSFRTESIMTISTYSTPQTMPLHYGTVAIESDELDSGKFFYVQSYAIAGTGTESTLGSSSKATIGQLYPAAIV